MSRDTYDPARAKPDTILDLCEGEWRSRSHLLGKLLEQLRSQCRIPRRTRAEVDAEIASIIREWGEGSMGPFGAERFGRLRVLMDEPTHDALPSDYLAETR